GGGLDVGDARDLLEDALRGGRLLRVAGGVPGDGRVAGRGALLDRHRRVEKVEDSGEGSGVPRSVGAGGDRALLPLLLLHGAGERGRDGGRAAVQLPGVRGGARVALPRGGTRTRKARLARPDRRRRLSRRGRLRPGEPGGHPEGARDRAARGAHLRPVLDLRPPRRRPAGACRDPLLRPVFRGGLAHPRRDPDPPHARGPFPRLLRPALHAGGRAHDARVRALHLRARKAWGGPRGHRGDRRAGGGRRPRNDAAGRRSHRPEGRRCRARDLRRGAGPAQDRGSRPIGEACCEASDGV
ncbi:MAG: hypothetical protein AVDCRST_MAG02-3650, partial [uncultured Rubrobacteraceae bacterium]